MVDNTFKLSIAGYVAYVWRSLGWKGFASKAAIPLAALIVGHRATMYGVNFIREGVFSFHRSQMVEKYTNQYGAEFLLNALNPSFRL